MDGTEGHTNGAPPLQQVSDGEPEGRPRPVAKVSRRTTFMSAISLVGLVLLVFVLDGSDKEAREASLREAIAEEGFPGARLKRQWFNLCFSRRESRGYRWSAPGAIGHACAGSRRATVWVDRTWPPDRR